MTSPFERWKQRTNDGRKMAGGWVSAKHTPPRFAQYEVRGHPRHAYLTWAYGSWWHQSVGDDYAGMSGTWHRQKGLYDWRGPKWNYCSVNWMSVVDQSAKAGNEQAKRDLAKAVAEADARFAVRQKENRS